MGGHPTSEDDRCRFVGRGVGRFSVAARDIGRRAACRVRPDLAARPVTLAIVAAFRPVLGPSFIRRSVYLVRPRSRGLGHSRDGPTLPAKAGSKKPENPLPWPDGGRREPAGGRLFCVLSVLVGTALLPAGCCAEPDGNAALDRIRQRRLVP